MSEERNVSEQEQNEQQNKTQTYPIPLLFFSVYKEFMKGFKSEAWENQRYKKLYFYKNLVLITDGGLLLGFCSADFDFPLIAIPDYIIKEFKVSKKEAERSAKLEVLEDNNYILSYENLSFRYQETEIISPQAWDGLLSYHFSSSDINHDNYTIFRFPLSGVDRILSAMKKLYKLTGSFSDYGDFIWRKIEKDSSYLQFLFTFPEFHLSPYGEIYPFAIYLQRPPNEVYIPVYKKEKIVFERRANSIIEED